MSRLAVTLSILVLAAFVVGCDDDDDLLVADYIPAAPQGVYSVTGDEAVYIYWSGPYESDIDGYIIWRSFEPLDNYTEIADVDAVNNPNLDLIYYEYVDNSVNNGVTYYYAVSSYDRAGNVSELSAEEVFDTPRPEGMIEIFDTAVAANSSAFAFSAQSRVSYGSVIADFFVDRVGGVFYINASDVDTDLQDVGYTDTLAEIGWAPLDGWSENGWQEIIIGHTYVFWTRDLHYAKVRVEEIRTNSVLFSWAYQTDAENPELKIHPSFALKPVHGPEYLIKVLE